MLILDLELLTQKRKANNMDESEKFLEYENQEQERIEDERELIEKLVKKDFKEGE